MMQQKDDGNTKEEIEEMVGGNSSTCANYLRTCKKITWSAVDSIPDELLFEILLRLPAKDIYFGARLVCRKWYNMMRSKHFIHKHLEHASYGLICKNNFGEVYFLSTREDGGGIDTFTRNCMLLKGRGKIWSSCNGLVLEREWSMYELIYYVTNFSTSQASILPPLPSRLYCYESSGIGYDATSMTYKVVVSYRDSRKGCAILTVGVDKSWRGVRTDHLSNLGRETLKSRPIFTEGFVHWNNYSGTEVVTLNLETEIIAQTPLPIPTVEENIERCFLSTGRCLSLFIQREKLVWEVFVMKPKTGKWRKLPDICLEGQKGRIVESLGVYFRCFRDLDIKPWSWLKYPEVLALRLSSRIIFYNLITCEISVERWSGFKKSLQVTLHKNSLVWF